MLINQPSHMAASNGDSEIVSVLIEYGANVNLLNLLPEHTQHCMRRHANAQIVSKLIRAGADVNLLVNDDGETALMAASASPRYAIGTNTPSLYRRQTETISLLIQARANVNAATRDGFTALLLAVWTSGLDKIRLLIDKRANVNQRTALGTPLMRAIETGDLNKVRLLVHAGAETTNVPANLFDEFIRPITDARDI